MTGGRGLWAGWLAWTGLLGLWSLRDRGAVGLTVVVAGMLFAGVAIAAAASRPRFAALAGAAAGAWFLADLWPGLLWLHRPLMAATVLSFSAGRLPRASARAVVVAMCVASVIPWAATSPQVTLALSAGLALCAWRELRSARLAFTGQGREARIRAGAAFAAALAVPAGLRWLDPFTGDVVMSPVIAPGLEVIYCVLVAVAGVIMMVALLVGVEQSAADLAVEVSRGGDGAVLERLREQAAPSSGGRRWSTSGGPSAEGRAVGSAIGLLERRLALQADLDATVDAVLDSRRRLVEATEVERMRLRRRLADRVMPLIPQVDSVLSRVDGASSTELVDQCRDEVAAISVALDHLANGLHPPGLSADGLADLRTAFSLAPIPVLVDVPPGRLPPEVEAAGWYACTEAVTNAVKHSGASQVSAELAVRDVALVGSVVDNGVGGARVEPGGGLAGLRDRLEALGGRLVVDSPDSGGTVVRFEVPVR